MVVGAATAKVAATSRVRREAEEENIMLMRVTGEICVFARGERGFRPLKRLGSPSTPFITSKKNHNIGCRTSEKLWREEEESVRMSRRT
jgi:hypothetical protein